MNESSGSINIDNSLNSFCSKETNISICFDNQSQISTAQKNTIINSIANNLQELITTNKKKGKERFVRYDIFYLDIIPLITLNDYIHHLFSKTKMEISTLIISIIYLDNFCDRYNYILSLHNIYKLLLTVCLLSIKFNEDTFIGFEEYAEIGGVDAKDLSILESRMIISLEYSFYVDDKIYWEYFEYFSKNEKFNKI